MKVDEKKRTPVEAEMIRLSNNLSLYIGAMDAFLFSFPHSDFKIFDSTLSKTLGLPLREQGYSFLDIQENINNLNNWVQPLLGEKDMAGFHESSHWTESDRAAFNLYSNFNNWSHHYRDFPPSLIPPLVKDRETWIGPWAFATSENPEPDCKAALKSLKDMAIAFNVNDIGKFNSAVSEFSDFSNRHAGKLAPPNRIRFELIYNSLDPFYMTKIFFGLAILISLLAIMLTKNWIRSASIALLGMGILIQGIGLTLRIAISGRPPVSNLFETFVFVAWICAILGLSLEFYNRKAFGILVGSLTGFLILMLSQKYSSDGDTIGVLVAVLNSNFWLATHVVTISLGYAGFCLAGVIGHFYVLQLWFNRKATEKLESLIRMTYSILAFGLIFSFIGTVLGGVWADQSWGRFWGWDPKENGALLIVLWGALLFHAKPAKIVGSLGLAIGAILGIIVVMMAWFGINLLGVGLHSYGFTSGVANGLAAYVSAEIIFIGIALYFILRTQPDKNILP